MTLPRLDNSNLWDKTYGLLKERIVRREFKPNEKLAIPELASQLGVSRTPIRDALNRLEKDGLVRTVSKVGTFVNALSVKDVREMMDTRLMLELWAVEKLAALPRDEVAKKICELEAILDDASGKFKTVPMDGFLRFDHNRQFHLSFMQLGKNDKNLEIYASIANYLVLAAEQSLYTAEMVHSAMDEHQAILGALKSGAKRGEFTKLKQLISAHLEQVRDRLITQLEVKGGQL